MSANENYTANSFGNGMLLDSHPFTTQLAVLTNALNATFVTKDGDQMLLQNDMGNGRIETAFLPSGYVPLGVKEYGGIIYIISKNPISERCQIGCFPSPERLVASEDVGDNNLLLNEDSFDGFDRNNGFIKKNSTNMLFQSQKLKPGDEYMIMIDDPYFDKEYFNIKGDNPGSSNFLCNVISNYGNTGSAFIDVSVISIKNGVTKTMTGERSFDNELKVFSNI